MDFWLDFFVWWGKSRDLLGGSGVRVSDINLSHFMRITIEGPNLESVTNQTTNRHIKLYFLSPFLVCAHIGIPKSLVGGEDMLLLEGGGGGGGGGGGDITKPL